jgi:hypothetical protein
MMQPYDSADFLTDENFDDFCVQMYQDFSIIHLAEFDEDMARIGYIKKLLTRYQKSGDLKERLILNHIITLGNVFRPENATRILFFKIDKEQWPVLKPFLEFLSYLPNCIEGLQDPIFPDEISGDEAIMKALRSL